MKLELEPGDFVAGMVFFQGHALIVTHRGYFYEVRYDGSNYTVQRL